MYRFIYKNYSFSEENLTAKIDEYAKGKYEIEKLSCDSTLAFRLSRPKAVIEVIFRIKQKTVYIDLRRSGDIDSDDGIGTDVIRFLAKSKFITSSKLPFSEMPIECRGEALEHLTGIILGKAPSDIPVIYLSKMGKHSYGYEIDEYSLAKKLYGIAHVFIESENGEDIRRLNAAIRKSERWVPTGGHIGIFYPDGSYNFLREPKTSSTVFGAERYLVTSVADYLTKNAECGRLTFDKLLLKKTEQRSEKPKEIVMDKTLLERLRASEAKRVELEKKLEESERKIERMQRPASPMTDILMPDIEEGREGEFRDFLIGAVEDAEKLTSDDQIRKNQIREAFLLKNPKSDYEEKALSEIDRACKDGKDIISAIKGLGFECVRNRTHTIIKYMGITLPMSCTPSDYRTKKNELPNIKNAFFVCS